MVEVAQTRELFSALISKPQLEDRLLQRPPFKFIHDIVSETIRSTGFLSTLFTTDELDSRKAGLNRDTKLAFVQKLVDALNADGDLDDVSAAKIVAGKEADRTNQLLQKLAIQAAANNFDRPTKQSRDKKRHRSSSSKAVDQKQETPVSRERQREEKKKEVEREKRRLSRALKNVDVTVNNGIDSVPKTTKKKSKKSEKSEEKVRDKSKEKSKEKTTKKKSGEEKSSKKRHSEKEHFIDEGIGSATPHLPQRREIGGSPIPRESSGGTSKAEDSGIAEPATSSGNELHDSERQSSATLKNYSSATINQGTPDKLQNEAPSRTSNLASPAQLAINNDGDSSRQRPTTAAGRPQTAIGRPGTSAARPAPPRIKKTKIGDIDPTIITPQPATFEKSAVIEDIQPSSAKSNQGIAENDFILDEEEEIHGVALDTQVAAELDAGEEHGALVNRIIANARDIQKESVQQDGDEFEVMDAVEAKKLRADVDSCRNSLQSVAQTVQPLSRTLEFVAEDFDVLLREIEESRKKRVNAQRQLAEKARRDDGSAALVAQLRNMDSELIQVRSQIAKTTASVIENERRINELMALNYSP